MFTVSFLSTLFGFLFFLLCKEGMTGTANSSFFSGEIVEMSSLSSLETECSSAELFAGFTCCNEAGDSCLESVFLSTVDTEVESLALLSDSVLVETSPKHQKG